MKVSDRGYPQFCSTGPLSLSRFCSSTTRSVRPSLSLGTRGLISEMSLLRRSTLGFLQEFVRGCKNPRKSQYSNRSQVGLYAGKDIRYVCWERQQPANLRAVAAEITEQYIHARAHSRNDTQAPTESYKMPARAYSAARAVLLNR